MDYKLIVYLVIAFVCLIGFLNWLGNMKARERDYP